MPKRHKKKDPLFKEPDFINSPFGVTREKGVYAICVIKDTNGYPFDLKKGLRVVYIGSSANIYKRLCSPSHIYRRLYRICKNYMVTNFFLECENHIQKEIELIKKYKPRFNKNYKKHG